MKTFYYYIKSHCEAPDIEGEIEADTKKKACKEIVKGWADWTSDMIENDVICEDCLETREDFCLH